ncbi:SUMF1/EgtB/PvdO family nonheme iron enzyme, partial [bacterium]|nr:SUMF1/EgtB/PvdO family nonheme iron enzyme [bacterium]
MKPGAKLAGRYTIEKEIGRGGMGSVFIAKDEKFGERVALKIAAASGGLYDEFKARFVREARLGNRLGREKGFVRALDWGELDATTLYLAMDLVSGARPLDLSSGSLEKRLDRLRTAARLVAAAHKMGVVHRDLKPANFLCGSDGTIWLSDFGLAKLRGAKDDVESPGQLTRSGVGMGTPTFMPPEQFQDARQADEKADVYSLGVMLFLVLTEGRFPFEGSPMSIMMNQERVREGRAPMPRARDSSPGAPAALDDLCARAMEVDPAKRLESANAFVSGLDAVLGSAPVSQPEPAERERTRQDLTEKTTPPASPDSKANDALATGKSLARTAGLLVLLGWRFYRKRGKTGRRVIEATFLCLVLAAVVFFLLPAGGFSGERLPRGMRRSHEKPVLLWDTGRGFEIEMVHVPPGDFKMGSEDSEAWHQEKPEHDHPMPEGYWIGRKETQWREYLLFCAATKHRRPDRPGAADTDDHPVVNVSWEDADAFCKWVGLSLPTEAQWEKAARGVDGRLYPWGKEWAGYLCNHDGDSDGFAHTAPVGKFPKGVSPFGALDMAGNV